MQRKLYLAVLIHTGEIVVPENTFEFDMGDQSVTFYSKEKTQTGWSGNATSYIRTLEFENEQVGYDTYTMELEGECEFTVEEFEQWQMDNAGAVEIFLETRKHAVAEIAEIVRDVQEGIAKGLKLAMGMGIPFSVQLDGVSFDLRKIKAVDWDSSSMYC